MNCIAIIPARGGSKRLPRKNVLPVAGKPMLFWPIATCLESKIFNNVIVSTDDDEVANRAKDSGAEVIMRPSHMASDTAHEFDAYSHVLSSLKKNGHEPEYFCGIYPTAALVAPGDLQGAYKKLFESSADVVMSVSTFLLHPFKALEQSSSGYLQMVYPEWCKRQSQVYPHYVASNGTFYFMRTSTFLEDPSYYPNKLLGYEIPADRAVDVNTVDDYRLLDQLMRMK